MKIEVWWSIGQVKIGTGQEQRGGGSLVFEPLVRGGSFNFQLPLNGGSSCFFFMGIGTHLTQ